MVVCYPLGTIELEQALDCLQLRQQADHDRGAGGVHGDGDGDGVHGDGDGVHGDAGGCG